MMKIEMNYLNKARYKCLCLDLHTIVKTTGCLKGRGKKTKNNLKQYFSKIQFAVTVGKEYRTKERF